MSTRALSGLVVVCCACAGPRASSGDAPNDRHPLAGKIYSVGQKSLIDAETVRAEALEARFVLLGEKHDNPEHHRGQAEILQALVDAGRRPTVVWEMIDHEQMAPSVFDGTVDEFGARVAWEQSGWPPYAIYRPIASVAINAGLMQAPGNLPPAAMRTAYREGLAGLDSSRARGLGVRVTLSGESLTSLQAEIKRGHCGYGDDTMLASMAAAQQTRDAFMASQLRERASDDGAVLIAGNGHVRRDRGVPYHLLDASGASSRAEPNARASEQVLVIGWLEVNDEKVAPDDYVRAGNRAFDIIFFTDRVSDEDPCDRFDEQIEQIRAQEAKRKERDAM